MSMTRPLRPAPARILLTPRQIPAPIDTGLRRGRSVDGAGRHSSAAALHASPQATTPTSGGRWLRPLLPLMLGTLLAGPGPVHAVAAPAPDSASTPIRLVEATPGPATTPGTTTTQTTAPSTATAPRIAPATATATAPNTATPAASRAAVPTTATSTAGPAAALATATAAPGPTGEDPTRLPLDDDGLPPNAEAIMRSPRFRHLAHELRCLVCQNQTLLDSHAPLAQDLRHEVVRLMARGMDDAQVRQHLVDRYGEFVLYRPSWSWRNAVLWLGPVLMLLAAALVAWRVLSRRGHALQGASGHVGGDEVGGNAGGRSAASAGPRTDIHLTPAAGPRQPHQPSSPPGNASAAALRGTTATGEACAPSRNSPPSDDEALQRAREALRQVDALLDPDHDPHRDKERRHG